MKHYVIAAKNKKSGVIEHIATSTEPHTVNPYGDSADVYDFEYYEFDNDQDEGLVRAGELLKAINPNSGKIKDESLRFSKFKKVQS